MRANAPFLSLKRSRICGFLFLVAVSIVLSVLQPQELRLHAAGGNSDGNIYWRGDFETGDFSNWAGVHQGSSWDSNSTAGIVTSPVPPGYHYAAKLTVIPNGNESARVELSATQADTGGYDGQEWYYSWSTYVPSVPNVASGWAQTNITQWMDLLYQCSPPEQIDILPGNPPHFIAHSEPRDNKNGCAQLGPYQDWDLGVLQYDQWNNFSVHLKFSADPSVGFIEVWLNGNHVLPLTHVRTLDTSGGVYMEQALYHPGEGGTHVIYLDATRRHDAYNGNSISQPTPTDVQTSTPTPTLTPSPTVTPTPPLTATDTPVPTLTPSPTVTPTPLPTATDTPVPASVRCKVACHKRRPCKHLPHSRHQCCITGLASLRGCPLPAWRS